MSFAGSGAVEEITKGEGRWMDGKMRAISSLSEANVLSKSKNESEDTEDAEDTKELSVHAITILTGVSKPPSSLVPGTNPLSRLAAAEDRIELAHGEGSRGHASSATGVRTRTWRKWRDCCHAAAQIFASCSYSPSTCHHSFVQS